MYRTGGADGWRPLPVSPVAFDEVRQTVFSLAGDSPETRQALLACDEWIANVASYSGANFFAFRCELEDGFLLVSFVDDGVPFDPTRERDTEVEFEDFDLGGMGLGIIRMSAVEMRYERREGQNVLTLRFALKQDDMKPGEAVLT